MISELLDGNAAFVKNEFHTHLEHYQRIAHQQSPQVLWIGCSDSRVSEDVVTGSKPGTIFVHRNIANIVAFYDVNVAAIVEYGHTKCGGIAAIEHGVEENYIADWLLIASGAKAKVDRLALERNLTREQKLDLLVEENVRLQIQHLKMFALIKNPHKKSALPRIHGWVYNVDTGKIRVVEDGCP